MHTKKSETRARRKVTLQEMQSIIGCLQFATSVIIPGRAFVRRLIGQTIGIKRPFHFVTLNLEAHADLNIWEVFLKNHNGKSIFLPQWEENSESLNLYTDASSKACAAVFANSWFVITFPQSWSKKNIAYLELYPILVALHIFAPKLSNSRVCFYTDNEAISVTINKQSCRNKELMTLIRPLVLCCMHTNIRFRAKHIAGKLNILPDRLSRLQVTGELLRKYRMNMDPVSVPPHLLPANFAP